VPFAGDKNLSPMNRARTSTIVDKMGQGSNIKKVDEYPLIDYTWPIKEALS
jgi:hypothetical protein